MANGPSARLYTSPFGSLSKSYELAGFRPGRDLEFPEINRRLRQLHPEIVERTQHTIAELGGDIWRDPQTDLLHLNQELVISLVLARCQQLPNGLQRWRIRFDPSRYHPDITVAVRLDPGNAAELDYYLLPRLDLPSQELQVTARNSAE
ncbi:MAG: recombinase family protein, partial [Burkholderiaceae bacterium]|nr:recombinase family protein [Burkholderiaceae bacterium]